jgi:hypothetical protein
MGLEVEIQITRLFLTLSEDRQRTLLDSLARCLDPAGKEVMEEIRTLFNLDRDINQD